MGWFRRLTGVSLKSKSRTGSPAPRDPADVDQAATPPGPSSRPAALEAGASPQIPGSPRASNPGAHRPGHRRTRSREAFGGRDDGIPVVPPRSPGFDAARGHQGFRDDPHARSKHRELRAHSLKQVMPQRRESFVVQVRLAVR